MKFSKIPLAQTITQLCFAKEIKHIVICPGSRNAPLTIGFTENPYFKVYSIVDERSAAFFALGIAQQTGHPVAVVCTSGSAVLNFYPAVAEAFYSDIPLLVISADRPPQYIDIGDGQTIRQENVFQNHILYSANLKVEEEHQIYNETQINVAINSCIEFKGPVHINAPFEEPLYQKVDVPTVNPQHVPVKLEKNEIAEDLSGYIRIWNQSKRKLILVGVLAPGSIEAEVINQLAEDESVLVLTETTSNLHDERFICSIDKLIASFTTEDIKAFQPELLITLGGMVISKKIKALLREYPAKYHWHIDAKKAYDTYFILNKHFKIAPHAFFKTFLKETNPVESKYQETWVHKKKYRNQKHYTYLKTAAFSDLKVFEYLFRKLPENTILQLSNSATVRYAQLFAIDKSIIVFCNRGTSGIDGSTSTSVGNAVVSQKAVTLITGDLSFFYDNNGLWNNYIPASFRVILVNNRGGGIFRILPGEKDSQNFDKFFETVHDLSARQLCEMHKLDYFSTDEEKNLNELLDTFFLESDKPRLLEIFTPRQLNDKVLMDYFSYIS